MFNSIPVCAIIDDKILCMHGGLSPDLGSPKQILEIERPVDVPDTGLLCDILWSDPESKTAGDWEESGRGVSYTFSEKIVD